ncbi:hypothetical protein MPSEU_000420600 [Mayamaea pseudoterrestris]|nr:hypothetical protein MPSEU_000420600 [Mayamaea pseudoterrestris]
MKEKDFYEIFQLSCNSDAAVGVFDARRTEQQEHAQHARLNNQQFATRIGVAYFTWMYDSRRGTETYITAPYGCQFGEVHDVQVDEPRYVARLDAVWRVSAAQRSDESAMQQL